MQLTLKQLIDCGATPKGAATYLQPLNEYGPGAGLTTPRRWAYFLAQVLHESLRMSRVTENLNYSAEALLRTWPKRFSPGQAREYARQPQRIANRAYAGRIGNGPESSGDGWRYKGRGLVQVTGRANYAECGRALGVDLVAAPELLETPALAVNSALWFWSSRGLNALTDAGDFEELTRAVNGGYNGMNDRKHLLALCEKNLIE